LADDLEGFGRFKALRGAMDGWGRGTWAVQHARLTLTREEAGQLIADQQELISRYQREAGDAPAGARAVVLGFLAYPGPPRVRIRRTHAGPQTAFIETGPRWAGISEAGPTSGRRDSPLGPNE
jgi:hypothetical protein